MSKPLLKAEIHRFLKYEETRKALEHHFGSLRPWSYFLMLRYRAYELRKDDDCEQDVRDWARACQKAKALGGGRFEYVFAAERVDPLEPPHLHGLVYIEAGRNTANLRLLEATWRKRHGVTRTRNVYEARGAAGYMFKEYEAGQPIFHSPSLGRPFPENLQPPGAPLPNEYYERRSV